ncbi:aquaporin [Isoptericola sp. BMS4]|uniref:aquaporin n=1 Tax=Isoptericola sp. BMS4 TaxID=2527875 RepID=UPI0014243200|nr:aquaporin [Isoptericola sp. BMS4]
MSQDIAAAGGTPAVADDAALDTPEHGLFARLAAEAFGTFVLVLGIVGTATFNLFNGGQILPVALAGGILVMGAIAAVGSISGGHFNPAVTFGLTLAGRSPWRYLVWYWVAQLVGGTAAAAVMFSIIPESVLPFAQATTKAEFFQGTANGFGAHSPAATLTASAAQQGGTPVEFTMWSAVLVEVIVTAVFVAVILGVTGKRTTVSYSPVVIGLTLGAMLVVAWPVTNGSLNPARSFASAVFGGGWTWGQLWVFVVAPLAGAALAALFYRAFSPVPAVAVLAADQHDVVDDGAVTAPGDADTPEWDDAGAEPDAAQRTDADATPVEGATPADDATDGVAGDAGDDTADDVAEDTTDGTTERPATTDRDTTDEDPKS